MKQARSPGRTFAPVIGSSLPAASRVLPFDHRPGVDHRVGRIDGDAVRERRGCVRTDDLDRSRREVALHDEHLGAGIAELVAEELALVRGVDRDLHRAELEYGEEADDLLGPVLEQRRDPVAVLHPDLAQTVREAVRGEVHLAGGELHHVVAAVREVEVRTVGIVCEALGERCEDSRLRSRHGRDSSVRFAREAAGRRRGRTRARHAGRRCRSGSRAPTPA